MNDHASALDLDEVAAGLAGDSVRVHVEACDSCRVRLAEITAARKAAVDSPGFQQTLARIPAARSAPRLRKLIWAGAVGVLAAAGLFLVVRPSRELRAKGSASIDVLTEAGQESLSPRVGDLVELKIAAGQFNYALVAAVDAAGKAIPLWPPDAQQSGPLPPGGHASVPLRVTPGEVRIVAAFSNQPVSINDIKARRTGANIEFVERIVRPVP